VVPLRNMGAALSPFNAFLILQGIETLPCAWTASATNTIKIARHLQGHPKVRWVNYAGLDDHPRSWSTVHGRPRLRHPDLRRRRAGAQPARASRMRFKLLTRLVNIGDAKSLACILPRTTHRQLSPEELAKAGVTEDMVRLSIGIEHVDDLIEDLDQALSAA
jgi:O-acetylhomoserine (thiol)-lyase